MQRSKIGLDFEKVEHARSVARRIADQVQDFVGNYTTVAVERTVCRLLGIDGIDENEVPLLNVVVDELKSKGLLGQGVAYFMGNAILETGMSPQQVADAIVAGKLDITQLPMHGVAEAARAIQPFVNENVERVRRNRLRRENYIQTLGEGSKPYLYIIVATGNIYEDVVQAQAGARQGPTSSPSSALRARACWTMYPTALRLRALAEPLPRRKTSASCARPSMRWAKRWAATSGCATTARASACPRLPPWAPSKAWT